MRFLVALYAMLAVASCKSPLVNNAVVPCVMTSTVHINPNCPKSIVTGNGELCFPFNLCKLSSGIHSRVWSECDFARHFASACRDFLVFTYLVDALKNQSNHPWLAESPVSSCALSFGQEDLTINNCKAVRDLFLCESTRIALNESSLLTPLLEMCKPDLHNLTSSFDIVKEYITNGNSTTYFFVAAQILFLLYFLVFSFYLPYREKYE